MHYKLLAIFMLLFMISCDTKKVVFKEPELPQIKYSKLVSNYKENTFDNADVKTIKIDSKMSYKIGKSSQKLGLKFRILTGEKIWLSADFLGIPVVKMLIEPDSIHYYNKFDKTFFEGSFSFARDLIGVNVTYDVLEKLFVGDLILDIEKKKYEMKRMDNAYFLFDKTQDYAIETAIYPLIFKTRSQVIEQVAKHNLFATYYENYKNVDGILFPEELTIKGINKGRESLINIKYNHISFNEELTFPFKIPTDCTKRVQFKSKNTVSPND